MLVAVVTVGVWLLLFDLVNSVVLLSYLGC